MRKYDCRLIEDFRHEFNRLCESRGMDCTKFELRLMDNCTNIEEITPEIIAKLQKWSDEHSMKTRQELFLEIHPNAKLDINGVLAIHPCHIDITLDNSLLCKMSGTCTTCKQKYWNEEVEK